MHNDTWCYNIQYANAKYCDNQHYGTQKTLTTASSITMFITMLLCIMAHSIMKLGG
jgi:hypothetical protein